MGCSGTHQHQTDDGKTVYMPCASHDDATGGYRSAEGVVQQRAGTKEVEVRQEGDSTTVVGYAAVFNSVTDLGPFKERIAPGAFADVLDNDVRFLVNHDGVPLARTTNGTMQLKEDETGLHYRAQLSDTQAGRDLYTMIKRGDISQSSFAFTIARESVDDENVRVIEKVASLIDTSAVTYPAYKDAQVFARSEEKKDND